MYKDLPKPVFAYVGRVSVEKNIEAFLELDLPGSKVVVGDGPAREDADGEISGRAFSGLEIRRRTGAHYADADVFVFPSFTDTFGLVILEAMAAGTPVAGFVAPGPEGHHPRHRRGRRERGFENRVHGGAGMLTRDARALMLRNIPGPPAPMNSGAILSRCRS